MEETSGSGPPKVVIHGAGSIGCFIGAAWMLAGIPVTLLGRRDVRDEIRANGLTVTDSERRRVELRPDEVDFDCRPSVLKRADLVVLAVKSNATQEAAREIRRHARHGTPVITFQNGIAAFDQLKAALPAHPVLRGMVPFNVARLGNGRWHKGVSGSLWVEDQPLTRGLAARIGTGPGRLHLSDDMEGVAWGKLLINLNNAVNALSGRTLLEQLSQRDYRRVVAASQVEALELLEAAGITPARIGPFPPRLLPHVIAAPDLLFRNIVLRGHRIDASARSSMADDFRAGRSSEVDYLNGEVVRLAERLGRKAPVNRRIVELVHQAEHGVEREWSAAELRQAVLGKRAVAGFGY